MKTYQKAIPAVLAAISFSPNAYAVATTNPDSYTITQGNPSLPFPVLNNDTSDSEDLELAALFISSYDTTSAQGGTIQLIPGDGDQTLLYTPPSNSYVGTDTFSYTADDYTGEYGSSALVTVTVEAAATEGPAIPALTDNERKISVALDNLCASIGEGNPPPELAAACSTTGLARVTAIQQLVPSQLPSQGNYTVELQHNQFMNITARLEQLRGGSAGVDASNLSLNFEGQPLLTRGFAYLLSNTKGGGASADQAETMGRVGVFINGSGSFGDRDTTDDELGFDFSTAGISAGVDYRLSDQLVFGGALGYVSNDMDFETSRGDQEITGYTLSAYGSWYQSENAYIDGILSYGTNNFDMTRHIQFGTTDVKARGETDGKEFAVSIGGAYDINREAMSFGPFVRVNYIKADIDAFSEADAGGLELSYDDQEVDSLTSLIGGQFSYVISTQYGVVTPQARVEWAHEFKHDSRNITARFLNDPSSGRFAIGTDDPDRNYFNLGLGVSAVFAEGRSAFIYYESVLGRDNLNNNSIAAGVRFEF